MPFGVYVHIPYCLQRCVYCDFATYEAGQILPPQDYIEHVKKEITFKCREIGPRPLDTVYFGGGTPSLLEPDLLIDVLNSLGENGFALKPAAEITMEINPATLDEKKIEKLVKAGFNRFSVGAQSFEDDLLKKARRRHSAQDTRDTLSLLRSMGLNFSLDILFALPGQTMDVLKKDVEEALKFNPYHVSPYCLTVPEGHPFSYGRPEDDIQVNMFAHIEKELTEAGILQYEISNFAKPGFESRHNLLYWNDDEYWGVGLSSHSYLHRFEWGYRFWNPRSIGEYAAQIKALKIDSWRLDQIPRTEGETLERHQALTDYFHISLRRTEGLSPEAFKKKFHCDLEAVAGPAIQNLLSQDLLIQRQNGNIALTRQGRLLSNRVFEDLTFLKS